MDLRQIQYFIALFEENSITKAAKRLHVVQPAVSMQIRRLEIDYGVTLFDRKPNGVYPNAMARAIYPLCRETLLDAERIRVMLRESSEKLFGELSVGVPPSLAMGRLAPVLVAFHAENPGLQVRVREGYNANLFEWLIQGDVDFVVVTYVDGEKRLQYRNLITEELVAVIGPGSEWVGDTIRGADMCGFKLVMPLPEDSLRMMVETHFSQAGIGLDIAMEINSLSAVCNVVQHSGWATILPFSAVPTGRYFGSPPRILRLVEPSITRNLSIAHQPHRELSNGAELLIEHLTVSLRGLLAASTFGVPRKADDQRA